MKVLHRLSVSGLVALACLSSAQAEITINRQDAGKLLAIQSESSVTKSSIYLVQMRDEPAIAYKGGVAGFKGTRPAKGGKLQAGSKNVQDYVAHLDATHNRAISSVNAKKVYSYRYGFNGFAARMTASDAAKLQKRGDVVRVWKDEIQKLQTNTSPNYIGVSEDGQAWSRGVKGEDIIVASIDTGIWPEHPSFADEPGNGSGNTWPWQGHRNISRSYNPLDGFESSGCAFGNTEANPDDAAFSCNDKLLTAHCYNMGFSSEADPSNPCGGDGADIGSFDFQSARDYDGHGSHTTATAAGNNGVPASIDGQDLGEVSGIAPRARIASYKVCWDGPDPTVNTDDGCAYSDTAAAIDQAIADGVDVINYSVGGSGTIFGSPADIGFLYAADAGIFVATSNGNSGPDPQTTGTPAGIPWITSVGATQDNGVFGAGLNVVLPSDLAATYLGMEGNGDVKYAQTGDISALLVLGSPVNGCTELANAADVNGNIAFIQRGACSFSTKYNNAAAAGARAIVVFNNAGDPIIMSAPGTTIPGQMISQSEGEVIASYDGMGQILANVGPSYATSMENRIGGFSSRGPNGGAPNIIKPDVSAPGVAILAAASPASSGEMFMSISGTSMASPHVAGAFALIKQAHPNWTPAMARSALMTTGRQGLLKTFGSELATPFDIGSGEILPTDALFPGLIYNVGWNDYLAFSCGNNTPLISSATCNLLMNAGYSDDGSELNLPSIAISDLFGTKTISRTFTKVDRGNKRYSAVIDAPPGVEVSVSPSSVWLGQGQSTTYEVTFSTNADYDFNWAFGSLTWSEPNGREVRSPIAILAPQIETPAEVDSVASEDGSGSVDVPVAVGYTGDYMATMSGLEEGSTASDTLAAPGDSQAWCIDIDANVHTRIATFDVDTTAPGEDDLDLTVYLGNADCANITGLVALLGSSGGPTSEEVVDIANGPAGSYYIFVDHYAAPADGPIDYTLWIQPVFADNGNTTVTAPSEAVAGSNETVTVDYAGLISSRYLGVLHHEDANGEIARTLIDVDATAVPVPVDTP